MRKFGMMIFHICQSVLLAFLLMVGIGSMPSVFGMAILMLAVFVMPKKIRDLLLDDWFVRLVWICGLLAYLVCLPEGDMYLAGKNMETFLQRILGRILLIF